MAALAMQVAFESCNEWHRDLLTYLAGNRDYLVDRMQDLPITMSRVEATYLAWLDVRALELADPATYFEEAGVGMSDGAQFGGGGYMRLNFGCPRSRLGEVVDRLQAAVEKR
jgi:cystathionine beta-lyase